MRPSAFIPVALSVGALILSFLCLFAGHKRDFLQGYDVMTLNTSRIGTTFINETDTPFKGSNPFTKLINNITQNVSEDINEKIGSIAEKLGVEDFYSAHILDYCWGTYTPGPVANSTLKRGDIDRNVSSCSPMKAMFFFDPTSALNQSLQDSGSEISLPDLNWPEDIQRGLDALRATMKAIFVLYCISIAFTFLSFAASVFGVFSIGRLTAAVNLMLALLSFLVLGIVSGIITAFIVKASNIINKYGGEIGIEAHRGTKFLALTWAATAAMLIAAIVWSVSCVVGHRNRRRTTAYPEKGRY